MSLAFGSFSLRIKKHPSQRVGNLFKINLFSVCRYSVESTMAPVCSQLSPSECKSTREYLFHSFFIFSCCSRTGSFISPFKQKLISSIRLLKWCCITVWLPVTTTSCSDKYANFYGKLGLLLVPMFEKGSLFWKTVVCWNVFGFQMFLGFDIAIYYNHWRSKLQLWDDHLTK